MDWTSLAIGGVALIPIVIGLTEVAKKAGLTGNTLMWFAMGLGGFFGLLFKLYQMFPMTQVWIELVVFVIGFSLAGLAATGIYDLAKELLAKPKV